MGESRHEFLVKKYVDTGLIPDLYFDEILKADPTTRVSEAGEITKVGKYAQWILRLAEDLVADIHLPVHMSREFERFMEDLYKLSADLSVYDAVKRKKGAIPDDKTDINKVSDHPELFALIKKFNKEEVTITKAEFKKRVLSKDVTLLWEDDKWDVITPSNSKAAIAVSGPPLTRWCTASEGSRNIFESYNRQGPLFIIRDKTQTVASGRGEGQPRPMYQFHFETSSFMDPSDIRVDIVNFLQEQIGLKMFFKDILKKYFLHGKYAQVKYPTDNPSKYIMLYGFDDFFNVLPLDLDDLDIDCGPANYDTLFELPDSIVRFKQLESIYIRGCVSKIPENICKLTKLYSLSFQDCHHLKKIPECIKDLPNLLTLNVKGSEKVVIPEVILQQELNDKLLIIQ